MINFTLLAKEKIVSLSEVQRNPMKAFSSDIVRIVKNGKEIGIFLSKEEFEDLAEEYLPLKATFRTELNQSIRKSKKGPLKNLKEILT